MKHSFAKRLEIVLALINGTPIAQMHRISHIEYHQLRDWLELYRLYGESGLKPRSPHYLDPSEKEHLVRLVLEKGLSLRQVYIHNGIDRSTLKGWIKKVRKDGYLALYDFNQARRIKDVSTKGNKRVKPIEPLTEASDTQTMQDELKKLRDENLRLRAENALLKKAKALMEEQESRLNVSGYKSSNH
jgi:transposase